jgi:hypothetical protein
MLNKYVQINATEGKREGKGKEKRKRRSERPKN